MSVVVFHTSVASFVQQTARAIHEAGQLERFITTVCDYPASALQRVAGVVGRLARHDLAAQFRRRAVTEVPLTKVESHPWAELLRLMVGRVDRDGRATDFIWQRSEQGFDRLVARSLHRGLSGVYGFEYGSLATFRRARELGVKAAYEVPAAESRFVQALLARETAKWPELRTVYHRYTHAREEERIARRRAEWSAANLIIVNSAFTKSTYAGAGLDCRKVRVVNLGAPAPLPREQALAQPGGTRKLSLIWAGKFSLLKGAHYLLEAWRLGAFGRHAQLDVFGRMNLPPQLVKDAPDGIVFHGAVPRSELLARYQRADALIFPTLCDGFGMVATEAWSRGLPVITTANAGAADLLRPDYNGRLVPAGDATALAAEIDWCLNHRAELAAMREGALATATAWQWSDFRCHHSRLLREAGLFSSVG